MQVRTRSGLQDVDFNKILQKVSSFSHDLHTKVDPAIIAQKTIQGMVDGITTKELDELSARISANHMSIHPDYATLGARILVDRLHKELDIPNRKFVENLGRLFNHTINGRKSRRISQAVYDFSLRNADALEEIVDYSRDFGDYDYFAIQGFMTRGLERINGEIAEVPSQMFLRIAIGLNVFQDRNPLELDEFENWAGWRPEFKRLKNMNDKERLENIELYYNILSKRELSLPGPINMHAGSDKNAMASCFLVHTTDSLTEDEYPITGKVGGIMKSLTQVAKLSQGGAGMAVNFHDVRSSGSPILSSNGKSNGIIPFMKMFDATIGAVNQTGKRAGVCTIYLEPWHKDIRDFLDAADHFAIEEKRCKNLFFALWMNDLFFERLVEDKANAVWTLFDPAEVLVHLEKPLSEYYGEEFNQKYKYLESLGIGETIPLIEIWSKVLHLFQIAGRPYILSKDAANRKTNQQNIGVVRSSNICTEITLASNADQTGVCVLSSICISRFYDETKLDKIDYDKLIHVARVATRHLNNVIDLQYYSTPETRNSCLSSRAIGIGCQGLADLFHTLGIDFVSDEAKKLNRKIYEAIYFGCMWESMELAKVESPYHFFQGSPVSKGILQYDMWGIDQKSLFLENEGSSLESIREFGNHPWAKLKELIQQYGVRNSEVTAIAPTANASIRMQQNEMHEPFTRNIYIRQYIGGSIQVVNKFLVEELQKIGLWNNDVFEEIMYNEGSIQSLEIIPEDIRKRFRTVYEYDWHDLIDMMADRSAFVSQSGSFNHHTSYAEASPTLFTQKILYAWQKGLKSISYYMHTETASTAKKELGGFSRKSNQYLSNSIQKQEESEDSKVKINSQDKEEEEKVLVSSGVVCKMDEDCEFCSS